MSNSSCKWNWRAAAWLFGFAVGVGCSSASDDAEQLGADGAADVVPFAETDASVSTDGLVWLEPIDANGDTGEGNDIGGDSGLEGADTVEADDAGEAADAGETHTPDAGPIVPPEPERAWPDGMRQGQGWPKPNVYSWDGSVHYAPEDFPLPDMLDSEYGDGHTTWWGDPSPVLPPGAWDWNDAEDDLANWRNFEDNIGHFAPLHDAKGAHFGWRLASHAPAATAYSGPSHYYEGCKGPDVLSLGPQGRIHSFEIGDLGDGPDLLVFNQAWSLDFRTGGIRSNPATDNDLVVGGCTIDKVPGYEFETATVHTGPGDDWIFARDMRAAAIDAGNGANGNTSYIDPYDGDDWVMLHGYMKDIRVFGGAGDDVVFWHLDEMVDADISFFGPNFFGEGGAGNAIWAEGGTDRMVFGVSPDTLIVDAMPTPPGGMLVRIWDGDTDEIWWDEPVYDDPFARYCITCGTSDTGRKTMNLEYLSPDGTIFTGWFWVTNFEEFQFGVGTDARVYRVDDVHGVLVEAPDLKPILPPEYPYWYCAAPLHPAWPNADAVDVYEAP